MANHFRAVGFPFDDERDFQAFCRTAAHVAPNWLPSTNGYYLVLGPDEGVQWIGLFNRDKQPAGGNPHYVGCGRLRLQVATIHCPSQCPLEAVLVGQLCDSLDNPTGPPVPVAVPDFDVFRALLSLPETKATFQVAAFAEDVEYFASEADFLASQGRFKGLSSDCFIPIGTFTPDGDAIDPPQPRVLMVGRIGSQQRRTNHFSGLQFWAISFASQGATYDVVAADDVLQATPVSGGILAGTFYLSAQAAPDERLRASKVAIPDHPFRHLPEVRVAGLDVMELGQQAQEIDRWTRRCFWLAIGSLLCFPLALISFVWSAILLFRLRKVPYPRKWMVITALVLSGSVNAFFMIMAALSR